MKLKFIIEKTNTGYSTYEETNPIFTTGATMLELQKNAREASELYTEDSNHSISSINFELDLKQFFDYYKIINAKHLAKRIGMNETLLSQYVNGKKKPSSKQIDRIVTGLQDIGKELMDLAIV